MTNWLGVLICVVYIFSAIGLAEGLRRTQGYSSDFTRKVIHISVGMLTWAVPFLFDSPWYYIAPCLAFAVLNFLDWRFGFVSAMSSSSQANLGTVYFPITTAIVTYIFWSQPPLLVAAMMPLTWGDGMAPIIGRAYGKRKYTILGHTRSIEGSLAFFAFGFFFTWLALWLMPGMPELTPLTALAPAGITLILATLTEAISPYGLDNLTVTAIATLVLTQWPF